MQYLNKVKHNLVLPHIYTCYFPFVQSSTYTVHSLWKLYIVIKTGEKTKYTRIQTLCIQFCRSYLNQSEYFILNNGRWVVLGRDNFNKHAINEVSASH